MGAEKTRSLDADSMDVGRCLYLTCLKRLPNIVMAAALDLLKGDGAD